MQALCGLQGIFDLFNCKTPGIPVIIVNRQTNASFISTYSGIVPFSDTYDKKKEGFSNLRTYFPNICLLLCKKYDILNKSHFKISLLV